MLIRIKSLTKFICVLLFLSVSFQKISAQAVHLNNFYPKDAPAEQWQRAVSLKTAADTLIADSIYHSTVALLREGHNPEAQLMILSRVAGYTISHLKDFEKAGHILDTAQKLFITVYNDTLNFAYADFYNTKAIHSGMSGNQRGRLTNYQKAYTVLQAYDSSHEAMPLFMRNLMQCNFMLRQVKDGFFYCEALREFAEKNKNYYYLADAYMGAGNIIKFYKPELSALFFEHVLFLAEYHQITELLNDPFFYISLGSGHTANNNHNKALELYKRGLDFLNLEKNPDDNNLRSSFYYYIGVSYKNIKDNTQALIYLDSALIFSKEDIDRHPRSYYRNLNLYGQTLNNAQRFDEALPVNKEVLAFFLKSFGKNNAYFTPQGFMEVSRSYSGLKQYNNALEYAQKAIYCYLSEDEPDNALSTPEISLLTSPDINYTAFEYDIYKKIDLLKELYIDTKDPSYLVALFEHFDFVMKVTDIHASKGQTIATVYDISARYKQHTNKLFDFLHELDMPLHYRKQAYLSGAKSKSYSFLLTLLQKNISDDESITETSEKKKELIKQLPAINQSGDTLAFIAAASERLIIEKQEFIDGLSTPLNAENFLIPQLAETRLIDIHEHIKADEFIVDYYLTNKYIHAFIIDDKNFEVHSTHIPENLKVLYSNFFRGLKTGHASLLKDATTELSELLLKHLNPGPKKNMVFVPDEQLWAVPFEVLTKDGKYLTERTAVSYRYTSPIFRTVQQTDTIYDYAFLAFAPVFDKEGLALINNIPSNTEHIEEAQEIFRDGHNLAALPSSVVEVLSINEMFGNRNLASSVYLRHEAEKNTFFKTANKARILHIATHGLAHNERPELSGLFLSGDGFETDFLYIGEIIDLPITADLIVLSACKSGYGAILRGEGIMGISKSFLAAGANNVIASLWKVHDEKTNIFMQKFYDYLLQGFSYASALQKVKSDFIKQNEIPMDWGGFIIIEK